MEPFKFGRKNAFKPVKPEDLPKEALDSIADAREAARKCFNSILFIDFKKKFLIMRETLFQVFLSVNEESEAKEYKIMKQIRDEINVMQSFVDRVESDAEVKKD